LRYGKNPAMPGFSFVAGILMLLPIVPQTPDHSLIASPFCGSFRVEKYVNQRIDDYGQDWYS
jgi:hypothetical protein